MTFGPGEEVDRCNVTVKNVYTFCFPGRSFVRKYIRVSAWLRDAKDNRGRLYHTQQYSISYNLTNNY